MYYPFLYSIQSLIFAIERKKCGKYHKVRLIKSQEIKK